MPTTASHPARQPRRVIKLGGSLLNLPRLGQRVQGWLASEPEMSTLMLVGGGDFVDAMRQLDALHTFQPQWCHWVCIELMATTAHIVESLIPEWRIIRNPEELECFLSTSSPATAIVHVPAFYPRENASAGSAPSGLPESWATTSDTLAAYLARQIGAVELVLLKSALPDCEPHAVSTDERGQVLREWGRNGYVDAHFCEVASRIQCVRAVDLRSATA